MSRWLAILASCALGAWQAVAMPPAPTAMLAGRVLDGHGQPPQRVSVQLPAWNPSEPLAHLNGGPFAITDAVGRYRIVHNPAGTVTEESLVRCGVAVAPSLTLLAAAVFSTAPADRAPMPVLRGGSLPMYGAPRSAGLEGTIVVSVRTDGERVIGVDPVRGDSRLAAQVTRAIKAWHFAAHAPTTFESTWIYRLQQAEQCEDDANSTITLTDAGRVTIEAKRDRRCQGQSHRVEEPWVVASGQPIAGRLQCRGCATPVAVAGATVMLVQDKGLPSMRVRSWTTDDDGRFRLPRLSVGTYEVSFSPTPDQSVPYEQVWGDLRVSAGASTILTVDMNRLYDRPPKPVAEVMSADLPVYPRGPLSSGSSGSVRIRVYSDKLGYARAQFISGSLAFANAAEANVKTWRLLYPLPASGIETSFVYQLDPTACRNQASKINARLPERIEVIAGTLACEIGSR